MNQEIPDVPAEFRKSRETRDQIATIHGIIEKAREFQKNIYFIDYAKTFDCVDHNKLWKVLKEMEIPDHLTCLLRNLYAHQETTAFKENECYSFFYKIYIKISRRNINNLRYVDDTILTAESKEEPKSLLMKMKEESEKAGLKLNIQKMKIMASGPIPLWQLDVEKWKQ